MKSEEDEGEAKDFKMRKSPSLELFSRNIPVSMLQALCA
jgi:hypothetical protein